MYFSYGHEDGIKFHDTLEEAKAEAESALDLDRDYAPEGWHDEVDKICYGEISGQVVETERKPAPNEEYDEYVEYALVDTSNVSE